MKIGTRVEAGCHRRQCSLEVSRERTWLGSAERLFASDLPLVAPQMAVLEIANVLSRKVRLGEIERAQANAAMEALLGLFSGLTPDTDLAGAAYRYSVDYGHPVYDTAYLALAEQEDGVLVTADEKFIARFEDTPFRRRFVALNDAAAHFGLTPAAPPAPPPR